MQFLLSIIFFLTVAYSCDEKSNSKTTDPVNQPKIFSQLFKENADTIIKESAKPYSEIIFEKKELIVSAPGTKSVLFNSDGSKLYAMNLEGMSVYEFDERTKKILRQFSFKPTKGIGWDYKKEKPIPSYQEKPVEACLSNHDKILWVSLHNAGGIVPIILDSAEMNKKQNDSFSVKDIIFHYTEVDTSGLIQVPLIKTGKTPKIISKTADDKYLLVSNWHSHSISVIELNPEKYPFGKMISTIPVVAIPRGIAVDDKRSRSYVAIMGGASIDVINNWVWQKEDELQVASNPRHIVLDTGGRLFVSFNKLAQVACIDGETGKTLFTAKTHEQPRTIVLSKNQQFLFVTCYSGNFVDVFKINKNSFTKIYSIECNGSPVGVDVYEDNDKLEAWVCTYTNGTINVLTFRKKS
jgi:DNA-binding beta-propeller fold protein YncE